MHPSAQLTVFATLFFPDISRDGNDDDSQTGSHSVEQAGRNS